MTGDNKNLLFAIVLSVIVLIGWNYFYGVPQMEQQRREAQQQSLQQGEAGSAVPAPTESGGTAAPTAGAAPAAAMTREEALAQTPRVIIDTPKIAGSLSLRGARIDDVSLKAYHETVDPRSPNIVLLSPAGSPHPYYAEFGWVTGTGTTVKVPDATTLWTADRERLTPSEPVTLTYDNGEGLIFRRQISVDDNAMFTVKDSVENTGGAPVTLHPFGLVSRHGVPHTQGFYILHEGLIGVLGDDGLKEVSYSGLEKDPILVGDTRGQIYRGVTGGFVGITDKYWATAVIPSQDKPYDGRFSVSPGARGPRFQSDILGGAHTVAPGATTEVTTHLFAGAKEVAAIDGYEKALGIKRFDLLIDWGWFYFITKPLFMVIDFFFKLFGNFGVAILLVTVIIKAVFFPLANRSYVSMAKMKAVQPEMMAIRERYADDRVKQQQALMELYKKEKINPLAGCLPILIQIPVFFALYKVLFVTIEMRHAPFFGWIKDLAAPDPTTIFNLFGLIPWDPSQVPVIGHFLMVGVWPIIMGLTMFVQMKMNPEPTDPVQKTMFAWMPVIFTFMLASFPAGLVIYWSWNNLLSVLQQGFIMRRNGVKIELWGNLRNTFSRAKA
ncbi:membrane protein insertase YidC [Chelatococcus composti]|jgi:membrane protein insertase, YidC/Oxa1 family, N-terminal domain|uniref:Membrane protein insertase YidC n=1 Tax=Chelatococcus composti TaxID=1743235 RepID=A0A841K482_9HYPH|nr:membrane protein insertase YidC [Chelatococcus composti]MBB6167588.1 YidC/Oxa1 family membrane protein insertase [Chelatococcus composti]MBS7735791.1 membrane protein insertase YidC [Chelatococcus composti]PZN40070.1 MAG: membrane protein insertase YidC [Pseudomonadota bacterium]GGG33000.1 membrane protein insertase YidC [Chelatococcus composti]